MADLLRGSLGFLPVGEVLTLLSEQGATGTLHFSGSDGDAALHLVEGKLIKKERDAAEAALLRESGSFVFSDEKQTDAGETISLKPLVEQAAKRGDEYRRARAGLPDDSAVLRVVDNPEAQDRITLSREQWKVLSQTNGRRTVGELLREGDALATMQALKDLLSNKLIEVAAPEKPKPDPSTKPVVVPPEVLALDARAPEKSSPEKTVMGMKLPPVAGRNPSPESPIACLTMDSPDDQMFPLVEDHYQIGREPSNAIRLEDSSVSSVHARIVRTPQGFVLEDLNSRNGTFVNGDRIEKRQLKENDRVRFGKVQLIFNIAGDKPTVSPSTVFQQRPS